MKKEILIPLLIALITLIFLIVSFLVWLKPSPWLTRLKLRSGGLILSLTLFAACSPPQASCYEMAPADSLKESGGGVDSSHIRKISTETSKHQKKNKNAQAGGLQDSVSTFGPDPDMIRCYLPPIDE